MNDVTKKFVIAIFTICILYILIPKIIKPPSCESILRSVAEEECNVRIKKIEYTGDFRIIGEDPNTFKTCECTSNMRWWRDYRTEMEEGDYFIKNKGETFLQIVKRDTVITHSYNCFEE